MIGENGELLAAHSTPVPAPVPQDDSTLTERELEVLQAAAHGERNKEIAYKLGITERTVKAHLASIYQNSMSARAPSLLPRRRGCWGSRVGFAILTYLLQIFP